MYIHAVVILCLPGVHSIHVYTPGRHWIACLSPSNLPDDSGRCDQTFTAGYNYAELNVNCHEWFNP